MKNRRKSSASENTRRRLRQVALDLFREKGYQATTTRDVAAGLGVQQASLYYHIKNKEELLRGICYSTFLRVVENAEAAVAAAGDPLDAVREISRSHLQTTLRYQKECTVSLMECRALGPEYRAEIEALWSRYHMLTYEVLDDAKSRRQVRSDLPNKYLYTPLMCTLNWSVLWFRPGKGLSVSQLDELFATVYFDGAASSAFKRDHRSEAVCRKLDFLAEPLQSSPRATANETYAKLLNTACALFAKQGYQGTSIREIADGMGVQKASLYYYITSKEDLLYEITKTAIGHVTASVKWALNQVSGPEQRLYAFITAHVVSLLQHQNWHAASNEELLTFPAKRRDEIVALRDEYESFLRQVLAEAQDAGLVRTDVSPKFLGLVLLGMITHIYPWYQPEIDVAPAKLGFILADLFMTGIRAK